MQDEQKQQMVRELIKDVPNFPKNGIMFKDVTPLLADGKAFQWAIELLADTLPKNVTKLLAIESRGFIFAAALAQHLGVGMVLVRKPGKLPREVHSVDYELEYGTDQLQLHVTDINETDQVVVIDDVLATGGTAQAVEQLCEKSGAELLQHCFIIELDFLKGRDRLRAPVKSLFSF